MSKPQSNEYPAEKNRTSYSGTPKAFSHIKKIGPEHNRVASGEREKAPLHYHAPKIKNLFQQAHEGPREALGKPKKHIVYTPSGSVVAKVHAKHDEEKLLRNRKKDLQMKQWREAKITHSRHFNSKTIKPVHLREQSTPEILQCHSRKAALQKRLAKKKEQERSRTREGPQR